jgi:hypothetical protein
LLGNADVVVVVGRGLAVLAQRAVHHHRAEAQLNRALADVSENKGTDLNGTYLTANQLS